MASYRLYNSPSVGEFYTNLNSTNFIDSINATKVSGRRESHRIKAVDFNKNLFYAIIAVDKAGNAAAVSNVRGAFVPAPEVTSKANNVDIAALRDADGIDVVVANPPYVPDREIPDLDADVRAFEPLSALAGGPDGLDAYRRIARRLGKVLAVDGIACFEVGAGHADSVAAIFAGQGFRIHAVHADLAGIPRAVAISGRG